MSAKWKFGAGALVCCLVVAFAAHARTYGGKDIEGIARVVDGDGIAVGDIPDIRLQGIAAPEDNATKRDPGGPESAANLRALVEGKAVVCRPDGTKTRGRPVAVCYVGNTELGLHQVETGHARDCPRFSKGRYAAAEAKARAAGRDLSAIYPLPGYCAAR
jgi:endonuclease YncB( thermonuclease family)